MTMRAAEWDDDRLNAAFVARAEAGRNASDDLVAAVIGAVRTGPRARARGWRRSSLAAGAAVIAVVGLGGMAALTVLTRLGVAAIPSAAAFELAHLRLQVLGVAEAELIRDAGTDDREIAVHGWFRQLPGPPGTPGPSCHPTLRAPVNPALPQRCGETEQRIVAEPPDAGASIRPMFGMLDRTAMMAAVSGNRAADVVVIGHFDDRRSVMCGAADEAECRDTFLVDRIASVNGRPADPSTVLSLQRLEPFGQAQPRRTVAEVDALISGIAPELQIASRLAIPGQRIFEIEPSLGTGAVGIIDRQLVWVVIGLEPRDGQPPRLRTFVVDDTQPEAFEAVPWSTSNVGFVPLELPAPSSPTATPTAEPSPSPSPNPTLNAEARFPTSWLGLPVVGVADVLARQDPDLIDDTAMFVWGWYVAPDPIAACPDLQDDPGPIEQPCPPGQHWLLEQPEQLWVDPGGPWIDRRPTGPAINPIVLPDVPFDIPNLWFDTGPNPLPVVLLGHLGDSRSGYYPGVEQFVVDALIWRAGDPASTLPWLMEPSGEDATSVTARIERDVGPAVGTWLSVVAGADLAALHPDAAPELHETPAVWIARSLLVEDGRPRVRPILTADGGRRVWSGMNLLTAIELEIGEGVSLEIIDGPDEIVEARAGTLDGAAEWITGDGPVETGKVMLGVIRERPNELRIAWIGGACDQTWRLGWGAGEVLLWPRERLGACRLNAVRREVVLTLDHQVDIEAIGVSNGGAGG